MNKPGSRVRVINQSKGYRLNPAFIKRVTSAILKYIKKPQDTELEVIFLNDADIRDINKKYKGLDRPTDVLSFRLDAGKFGKMPFFGEIFISVDMALGNSKIFGTELAEELVLYVIHGILHLFGYDDTAPEARRRMSKKENDILRRLCKTEDLSKVLMRR